MTKTTISDNDERAVKSLSIESLDDSNRVQAVDERPRFRMTTHSNATTSPSTTVPGAFQVRLPWARTSSPAPSDDDDTEQWQQPRESTRVPNNNHFQLLEATMVPNDDDESVYDAVPLDHMENSGNRSRRRRLTLWSSVVIVVAALITGLAVGLTRPDPPALVTTRSSKLAWITSTWQNAYYSWVSSQI